MSSLLLIPLTGKLEVNEVNRHTFTEDQLTRCSTRRRYYVITVPARGLANWSSGAIRLGKYLDTNLNLSGIAVASKQL